MFQIGLVSVSFRALAPEEIARLCADNGLSFVEWGSDVHAPKDDAEKLRRVAALSRNEGLVCPSYGTYFRLGENDAKELYGYAEAARCLGTDRLRIWGGKKNYGDLSREERSTLITEAKKAARIAEETGVTLSFECHNKTFTNCLEGTLDVLGAVDSPRLRMHWQPNQFRTIEENLAYAARIAPLTDVIHVFEWEGKERYPLSRGIETWQKYLSLFDRTQKLLLEFMPDDRPESLGAEVSALKEILEGLK